MLGLLKRQKLGQAEERLLASMFTGLNQNLRSTAAGSSKQQQITPCLLTRAAYRGHWHEEV